MKPSELRERVDVVDINEAFALEHYGDRYQHKLNITNLRALLHVVLAMREPTFALRVFENNLAYLRVAKLKDGKPLMRLGHSVLAAALTEQIKPWIQ
jgi:hypothetical protein